MVGRGNKTGLPKAGSTSDSRFERNIVNNPTAAQRAFAQRLISQWNEEKGAEWLPRGHSSEASRRETIVTIVINSCLDLDAKHNEAYWDPV